MTVLPASARMNFRDPSCASLRSFFDTPQPAGRKITAGFTYLQRIGKGATHDIWFPHEMRAGIDARLAAGQNIGPEQFPAQWAAVRQFELLQESGNHKIYDLDPQKLQRSMLDLTRGMRAGGYRITVATVGSYRETSAGDDLEILDLHLQERIGNIVHMLYLDEASRQANEENDAKLAERTWDFSRELPHVGVTIGAQNLFCNGPSARNGRRARAFFEALSQLPHDHILHDTAIGLQLPELTGRNQWNYIASPEETLGAFNRVLGDLFGKFDHLSLSRLQGRENATAEIMPSTLHMRGYGDHMSGSGADFNRRLSLSLN